MSAIPDKNFYRPDELARVVDLPIKTVYRLMRRGLVQHVHVGRSARIPREEFIRILNGGADLSSPTGAELAARGRHESGKNDGQRCQFRVSRG